MLAGTTLSSHSSSKTMEDHSLLRGPQKTGISYGSINGDIEACESRYVSIRETFAEHRAEVVDYRARPTRLTLWDNDVLTGALPGAKKDLFAIRAVDIVGVSTSTFKALFVVHVYENVKGARVLKDIHITCTNAESVTAWVTALRSRSFGVPIGMPLPPARRVTVIINPFGGTRKAPQVFQNTVRPMFERAGVQFNVIVTTHANHATEICQKIDLNSTDIIATVSGDGLLHECVQGLMGRADWQQAIIKPIAIIPGGSGNGLAEVIGCSDPSTAAFAIVKGQPRPIDVMAVYQEGIKPRFGFLSLTWAIISDVDILSESLRWMGPLRFTIGAIKAICAKKHYYGKLRYVECSDPRTHIVPPPPPCIPNPTFSLPPVPPTTRIIPSSYDIPLAPRLSAPACLDSCVVCLSLPDSERLGHSQRLSLDDTRSEFSTVTASSQSNNPASVSVFDSAHSHRSGADMGAGVSMDSKKSSHSRHHSRNRSLSTLPSTSTNVFDSPVPPPTVPMSPYTASTRGAPMPFLSPSASYSSMPVQLPRPDSPKRALAPVVRPVVIPPSPVPSNVSLGGPCETPTLESQIPSDAVWHEISDDFIFFLASNLTHLSKDTKAAPFAHMSDGLLDVSFVTATEDATRFAMLKMFVDVENGSHVKHTDLVRYVKTRAIEIEPIAPLGILDIDGELIPSVRTRIEMHRGLARLMSLPV